MCLNAGGMGWQDYETETLIPTTGAVFDVTFAIQERAVSENLENGPQGMGVQKDHAYTLEARNKVQAVAHALRGEGFDASEDGTGRGTPIVPMCIQADAIGRDRVAQTPSVDAEGRVRLRDAGLGVIGDGTSYNLTAGQPHCVAFAENQRGEVRTSEVVNLTRGGGKPGQGYPAIAFSSKDYGNDAIEGLSPTLRSMGHDASHANGGGRIAVAFDLRGREGGAMPEGPHDTANIRAASGGSSRSYVAETWAVRRLTPTECERLQGFPDGWTDVTHRGKPAADGPRYKALGNSMACNVMRWIGERIAYVENAVASRKDAA